eukprot:COSAG04_NODE_418_length_14698_cov_5.217412_9_plen_412_part_00
MLLLLPAPHVLQGVLGDPPTAHHNRGTAVPTQIQAETMILLALGSLLMGLAGEAATRPSAADHAHHARWLQETGSAPFTLALGGVRFTAAWTHTQTKSALPDRSIEVTLWKSPPPHSLEVNVTRTTYTDHPVTETALRLTNTGAADTPVISDLTLLASFAPGISPFGLHWSRGSNANSLDYTPYFAENGLDVNESLQFSPTGGRSSNANVPLVETAETRSHSLPFWRITAPGKGGAIVAVGWTGQWLATFNATAGVSETEKYPGRIVPPIASPTVASRGPLVLSAGQQIFHSKLKPGESVRTPSLVVMTHAEPEPASVEPPGARAHNLWRALMIDHFTPRTAASDGDKLGPLAWMPVAPSAGQLTDWANESNQLLALKHLGEHNASFTQYTNTWWMVRLQLTAASVPVDIC